MTTICGHDREALKWALRHEHSGPALKKMTPRQERRVAAYADTRDPSKLSAIIVALLCQRGIDAAACHQEAFVQGAPRVAFLILWSDDSGLLDMWHGGRWRTHVTMSSARTFALRLLTETNTNVEQMMEAQA